MGLIKALLMVAAMALAWAFLSHGPAETAATGRAPEPDRLHVPGGPRTPLTPAGGVVWSGDALPGG